MADNTKAKSTDELIKKNARDIEELLKFKDVMLEFKEQMAKSNYETRGNLTSFNQQMRMVLSYIHSKEDPISDDPSSINNGRGILGARPDNPRFQVDPKESHLLAAKRNIKNLKGTVDVGLWYYKLQDLKLVGYADSDYATYKLNRKRKSGTCQFLGVRLVSWFSKQNSTENLVNHLRTKHIDVRHHFIRGYVKRNDVTIDKIHTDDNVADIFTKPLAEDKFSMFGRDLGFILLNYNILLHLFLLLYGFTFVLIIQKKQSM